MWATLLLSGLLLGIKHALEADHVAAVASLATRAGSSVDQTIRLGAAWGLGHASTLFLFGGAVLFFNTLIPEQVAQALEFVVGAMLLLLGADALRRSLGQRWRLPGADRLVHEHAHHPRANTGADGADGVPSPVMAFMVGMVHGLAGTAALVMLSLGAAGSTFLGLLYILVFGIGSTASMAALSYAIALPMQRSMPALKSIQAKLQPLVGMATAALGIAVMIQIGIPGPLMR